MIKKQIEGQIEEKGCSEYLVNNKISDYKMKDVLRSQINKCIKKNKSYKGFSFEYIDSEDN